MFFKISRFTAYACSALAFAAASVPSVAVADYPEAPVRLIVSTAVGGGGDLIARLFANRLSDELEQPVVVENKPGASGVIAATNVLRSPADGYTVLFGITTFAQLPAIRDDVPFDAKTDFIPISLIARSTNVLMASKDVGVESVPELVDAIKEQNAPFNFGSWGNGSTAHFMGAMFNMTADINAAHVPYNGSGPMMNDLLGGVLSYAFADVGAAQVHFSSDRIVPLAVTGEQRVAKLPDVPTMSELGYEDFDFGGWFGVMVHKDTPADIVAKLREASEAVGKDPKVQETIMGWLLQPVGSDGEEFEEFLAQDLANWDAIAKRANIRVN